MPFIESWDESTPPGSEALSNGDNRMRSFKSAIRERLAVDHHFVASEAGDASVGYHEKTTFINQGSDPSTLADALILYAKDANSKAELHSKNEDGTVSQLTYLGKLLISALDIASAARGDIIRRGASAFERLAIGAAHRLLRSDGTDGAWSQILNLSNLDVLNGARLKTAGGFNTDLSVTDPTANRTVTLPDADVNLTNFLGIKTGSYTGDGVDNREITIGLLPTTNTPKFFIVLEDGVASGSQAGGHWMISGMANGIATDGSSQATGIKSFGANKVVIGTHTDINGAGQSYKWFAVG